MKRFQGGLAFEAHRLLDHSTLGSTVIKKKRRKDRTTVVFTCAYTPTVAFACSNIHETL